jgi:hypothetical protein
MPDAAGPDTVTEAEAGRLSTRGLTRREGLLALALLAPAGLLAACTGSAEPTPGSTAASAPPVDLAAEVAAEESALIASYDAVLAAATGLGDEAFALLALIRDQHRQHLDALGGIDSPSPSVASAAPSTAAAAVGSLIDAERAAARSRIRACVAAEDADLARLLTFIGASEASHVPALRDLGSAGA